MWHFLLDTTFWVCVNLSYLDTAGLRPWVALWLRMAEMDLLPFSFPPLSPFL